MPSQLKEQMDYMEKFKPGLTYRQFEFTKLEGKNANKKSDKRVLRARKTLG